MWSVLPTAVVLALRTVLETEEVLGQCLTNELKNIYHIYVQGIEDNGMACDDGIRSPELKSCIKNG